MANNDGEEVLHFWYQGIYNWYNNQDYLQSIEDWEHAVDSVEVSNNVEAEEDEHELLPTVATLSLSSAPTNHRVAPLLLFLSGCHLDAQNILKARVYLKRCMRCSPPDSQVFRLAVQEYLSSFEEQIYDGQEQSGLRDAPHRIIQWAIDQGCTTYWTNAYQRPGFISLNIPTKPIYLNSKQHPGWCRVLENRWKQIRNEFLSLRQQPWPSVGAGDHRGGAGQHDSRVVVGGGWNEWVLFGSGAKPEGAPQTTNLLRTSAYEEVITLAEQGGGEVIFSVLAPHTRIRPHCATTNLRLTAHLGLQVPSSAEACRIRVADQWYSWEEGKMLVFDDSYEHEIENLTDEYRAVLLIRFWHPSLPNSQRETVLENVLQNKREDVLRRYNPPFPIDSGFDTVFKRGMEQSRCPVCWRSGYDNIRLVHSIDDPGFECVCGQPILEGESCN